jgi:carboxypeptidase C (cathepsin A)
MSKSRLHPHLARVAAIGLIFAASGLAWSVGAVSLRAETRASVSQLLPAASVTQHTLEVAGRSLSFTATAGAIPLTDPEGRVTAEMAYVAYTLNGGTEPRQRPVTFAFNGGPGSASSWLHLGALGPWRLRMDEAAASPSAPPALVPNAETWLDFTDLVFIDPVGTGYSHIAKEAAGEDDKRQRGASGSAADGSARHYWSVSGDIESIADVIQKWLQKADRLTSPKLLVGESYGGFRGPKLARKLHEKHGVGLSALVLVSPVLDFAGRRGAPTPFTYVALLPSLTAATFERHGQAVSRERLAQVEEYARGEYLSDLVRGPRDAAAVNRMVTRVAEFTGLPDATVRRFAARIDGPTYNREVNRDAGKVASIYDASVKGLSPDPALPTARGRDPFTGTLSVPLTSAMVDLYATRLGWRTERPYLQNNREVSRRWLWGNSPAPPESVSDLKEVLALDPRLRVMIAHGFTDLVTPYFASQLILDQLPAYGDQPRIALTTHPGGHMFYSRDDSRKAFREDALNLVERLIVEASTVRSGE